MSDLESRVFTFVARVPRGKVTTYKQVALAASTHPRLVGKILHHNPDPGLFPCHRVVRSDGSIASGFAFGGPGVQQARLAAEGVVFSQNGIIDLTKYGYFVF